MKYVLMLLILLVSVFPLGGVAYAQSDNLPDPGMLPDNPFYFLKSLWESVVSFFAFGDEAKAERALELSEVRLAEAKALIAKGETEAAGKTLAKYQEQYRDAILRAKQAGDKGLDTEKLFVDISESTINHQTTLLAIRKQMPAETAPVVEGALQAGVQGFEEAIKAVPPDKKKALIEKSGKLSAGQIADILDKASKPASGQPISSTGYT